MSFTQSKTIKSRILWPVTLFLAGALGILIWSFHMAQVSYDTAANAWRLDETAKDKAHELDLWAKERGNEIHDWTSDSLVIRSLSTFYVSTSARRGLRVFLKKRVASLDYYDEISVFDLNGEEVASSLSFKGKTTSEMEYRHSYFQNVLNTIRWENKKLLFRYDGSELVSAFYPVKRDGAVIGFINAVITTEYLRDRFISRLGLGNTERAFIFTEAGVNLAQSVKKSWKPNNLEAYLSESKGQRFNVHGNVISAFDISDARLGSVATSEWLKWSVGIDIDKSEIEAPARQSSFNNIPIAISTIFLLWLIVIQLLNGPIKALQKMSKLFDAMAKGQYDLEIDTSRKDELGQLSKSFSTMAKAIRCSNSDLQKLIAELTLAKNEAEELATFNASIISQSPIGITVFDEKGDCIIANESVARIVGGAKEQVLEQNFYKLDAWRKYGFYDKAIEALKTENVVASRVFVKTSFGKEAYLSCRFVPLDKRLLLLTDDVTNEATAKAELEQAKCLAECANQSKSTFLANMSHEIRTPMNGVLGMVEVLSHGQLAPEDQKMVAIIKQSGELLLSIIDDILDLSKIEAGKLEINPNSICLEDEIDGIAALLDQIALVKKVGLNLFFDPNIPKSLIGDPVRLRQILTNLINNGLKFSSGLDRVGQVNVRCSIERRAEDTVWVIIEVRDNGIGINPAYQEKLFDPFYQADSSTTRRFGGTGLGLVISRQLAGLMGGDISLESCEGEGSIFRVQLPFKVPGELQLTESARSLTGQDGVIVCDNKKLVDDFTTYLQHEGMTVHHVPSLDTGWDYIAKEKLAAPVFVVVSSHQNKKTAEERVAELIACQPQEKEVGIVAISYLNIEHGKRRKPRLLAGNVVEVDQGALGRRAFLHAVKVAMGRAALEEASEDTSLVHKRPQILTKKDALAAGCLILVVEDNGLNQEVILHQLEVLGYTADMASDGVLAYNKWVNKGYGLVLSDLHMPNMDGYELTGKIRTYEMERGLLQTPIIALTANAQKDEKEKCLALGMQGYVTKPVRLEHLKKVLDRFLPPVGETHKHDLTGSAAAALPSVPVDLSALTKYAGNRPDRHKKFLHSFIERSIEIGANIAMAFDVKDYSQISDSCHSLKSLARLVGANTLGDICEQMEIAGRSDHGDEIERLRFVFEEQLRIAQDYIEGLEELG